MSTSPNTSTNALPAALPVVGRTNAAETVSRCENALKQAELAVEQLGQEEGYTVAPLHYALPRGFLLSVVIPVYNERDTIRQVVRRVLALPLPLQIIIVDDESRDGTAEELTELEQLPDVQVIFKHRNAGKGAALRTGFEHAAGDVVIVQDADLEYDPRDIPRLIQPIINNEVDAVYGSRFAEPGAIGSSWLHQFGNRFLTACSNLTTGLGLTDMETCYKAFRRELLDDIQLRQDRFGFEPEFTAKLARRGVRLAEVPVSYNARDWQDGKKIGFRDGVSTLYCILRYAFVD